MEKEVQRLRELLEERHSTRTSSPTGSVDRPSTKEGSSADAVGAGDTGTTWLALIKCPRDTLF